MKKRLSVILSIILAAVSVSACGGSGSSPANVTDAQSGISSSVQEQTSETTDSSITVSDQSVGSETTDSQFASEKSDTSKNAGDKQSSADSSKVNSNAASSSVHNGTTNQSSSPANNSSHPSTQGGNTSSSHGGSGGSTGSEPSGNSTGNSGNNSNSGNSASNGSTANSGNTGNGGSTGGTANSGNTGNGGSTGSTTNPGNTGNGGSTGSTGTTGNSESSKAPDTGSAASNTSIGDQSVYNKLFSLDSKVTIEITMSKSEMDKMNSDYYKYKNKGTKSPIYRKATAVITVDGKRYTIDEVGIRAKGNLSVLPVYDENSGKLNLSHYKLSFNETFDDKEYYGSDAKVWKSTAERKARKNRRFATLKKLDVKWNRNYDDTYIREIYAAEMFRQSGVIAQKIGLSQLSFNNNNYGVMTIYEPIDEIFLERNLPKSALGGDLYKVGWTYSPANYVRNQVSIGVTDEDKGTKYNFDLKTNEKTSKNENLNNFLRVINSNPTQSQLEAVLDTDYFAKFLAAYYFAGDPDDIRNNYNNHYIYFRKDNGKAIFIPYDNDRTLGVTMGYNPDGTGMTAQSPYSDRAVGANQIQANPLIKLTIKEGSFLRTKYTAALKNVAGLSLWNTSSFEAQYNKAKANYQSCVNPSISFANASNSFKFSLDGKYPSGDNSNMSFSDYVTRIMKTYKTYVK